MEKEEKRAMKRFMFATEAEDLGQAEEMEIRTLRARLTGTPEFIVGGRTRGRKYTMERFRAEVNLAVMAGNAPEIAVRNRPGPDGEYSNSPVFYMQVQGGNEATLEQLMEQEEMAEESRPL